MPPPKKAAKKAAKKSAKHADPKHHELKDLRRAYEHLGRVECLVQYLSEAADKDARTLTLLAQQQLSGGSAKNAAELLRAAEHVSFAALLAEAATHGNPSSKVVEAVEDEYQHLVHSAEDHWERSDEHPRPIASIYKRCVSDSQKAISKGAYRQGLELIRAAGALAKVEIQGSAMLTSGKSTLSLAADHF